MPPRPPLLLRSIARAPRQWTCHNCIQRTTAYHLPLRIHQQQTSRFHTTRPLLADTLPNHYDTLQLSHTATSAEIKRQFYTLSKKHHPDRNQNDPEASTRFVAISEAYHVLSVPDKRAQYDAQLENATWRNSSKNTAYPQGSYSSAAYGSRPASGLNKKRSTFRGPPPSFYKTGGYGDHGAKRAEYAYSNTSEAGQESYGEYGGFGPGQQKQGNEVPHFNDRRHKEMHENVNDHIWSRRKKVRRREGGEEEEWGKGDMLVNFVMVSSVIAMIGVTIKVFGEHPEGQREKRT